MDMRARASRVARGPSARRRVTTRARARWMACAPRVVFVCANSTTCVSVYTYAQTVRRVFPYIRMRKQSGACFHRIAGVRADATTRHTTTRRDAPTRRIAANGAEETRVVGSSARRTGDAGRRRAAPNGRRECRLKSNGSTRSSPRRDAEARGEARRATREDEDAKSEDEDARARDRTRR